MQMYDNTSILKNAILLLLYYTVLSWQVCLLPVLNRYVINDSPSIWPVYPKTLALLWKVKLSNPCLACIFLDVPS